MSYVLSTQAHYIHERCVFYFLPLSHMKHQNSLSSFATVGQRIICGTAHDNSQPMAMVAQQQQQTPIALAPEMHTTTHRTIVPSYRKILNNSAILLCVQAGHKLLLVRFHL